MKRALILAILIVIGGVGYLALNQHVKRQKDQFLPTDREISLALGSTISVLVSDIRTSWRTADSLGFSMEEEPTFGPARLVLHEVQGPLPRPP